MQIKPLAMGTLAATLTLVAYAALQVRVNDPVVLSTGSHGDKPKLQRMADGSLLAIYGDSPAEAGLVYDVKAAVERPARDVFVRRCVPSASVSCEQASDWSAPLNVSGSALLASSGSFDWRGTLGEPSPYWGDIDKPNVKAAGSLVVVTWVGKHCPDGDLSQPGVQPSVQRGVRYGERDGGRVIPFSCVWVSHSTDSGATWAAPRQLSTGERDAIQDASSAQLNSETKLGQAVLSWQEDPSGLQLGEAGGPGDGASGAKVSLGTDIWYAYAGINLSDNTGAEPVTANDFTLSTPVRLTDNQTRLGPELNEAAPELYDGTGAAIDVATVETGDAGASRANIGQVGNQVIVAYEESKGSAGASVGKFIRYHSFTYNKPVPVDGDATTNDRRGCVISDPAKNARRVRFVSQGPADAGAGGIQLAIFWREGVANEGGPADVVLRLAGAADASTVAIKPQHLRPAVDTNCTTSVYAEAAALAQARAINVSSRSASVTASDNGLGDDTELNAAENALAHRALLRGRDLWVGYSYAADLAALGTQADHYNFWLRQYNVDSAAWGVPRNVSGITDKRINVREPRLFGTPKGSATACPSGNPAAATTTDPTLCQNADVVYVAWGTQENVPVGSTPTSAVTDQGIFIGASVDGARTFSSPVRYSQARGALFEDDEAAYEAQIATRPDGQRFFGVWSQRPLNGDTSDVAYASGEISLVPDPQAVVVPLDEGGGCSATSDPRPLDPALPLLALLAWAALRARRRR